jgi:hypothetical protein
VKLIREGLTEEEALCYRVRDPNRALESADRHWRARGRDNATSKPRAAS